MCIAGENLVPEPTFEVQEDVESSATAAAGRGHGSCAAGQPVDASVESGAAAGLHDAAVAARAARPRAQPCRWPAGPGRRRQPSRHEPAHLLVGHGFVQGGNERHQQLYAAVLVVPSDGPFHESTNPHLESGGVPPGTHFQYYLP